MNQQNEIPYRLLVANGVNLDLLGKREPEIYGKTTLLDIENELKQCVDVWQQGLKLPCCNLHFFQTNCEESFLTEVAKPWDGILMNPGAWTHTSLALADRLAAVAVPFVEVHLSNLAGREDFRKHSFTASKSVGVVYGMGVDSYVVGLMGLIRYLMRKAPILKR